MTVLGGGAALLAGVAFLFVARARARASQRRFESWCREDSGEPSAPPRLAEPFGAIARAVCDRVDDMSSRLRLRQNEARRAKLQARTLEEAHDVLRRLLENLTDGVVLIDEGGEPTFANRAARRLLGIAADSELGADLLDHPIPPALKATLAAGIAAQESRAMVEVDASDGTQRLILRVAYQEVSDDVSGESRGLAILLTDVTREVELNRMKSSFASSVSHELKTPLSSMRAFLEMLIDGDIDGEQERQEHLRMILDETERLTRLVQNLLNLSRLEAGVTRLERSSVSIVDVIEHLRDVVTPLAHARQQTIVFEISDFTPAVTGDRSLLEQGCMNLISNAIKYTPEGGTIRVRVGLSGGHVEVAVSDTGVGIPAKAIGLIFEKFTRIENTQGLKATGTGLGLPLAKFVANAHGGDVSVTSEVGKGSEFTLRLPIRRGDVSEESQLVGLEGITA